MVISLLLLVLGIYYLGFKIVLYIIHEIAVSIKSA